MDFFKNSRACWPNSVKPVSLTFFRPVVSSMPSYLQLYSKTWCGWYSFSFCFRAFTTTTKISKIENFLAKLLVAWAQIFHKLWVEALKTSRSRKTSRNTRLVCRWAIRACEWKSTHFGCCIWERRAKTPSMWLRISVSSCILFWSLRLDSPSSVPSRIFIKSFIKINFSPTLDRIKYFILVSLNQSYFKSLKKVFYINFSLSMPIKNGCPSLSSWHLSNSDKQVVIVWSDVLSDGTPHLKSHSIKSMLRAKHHSLSSGKTFFI